MWLVLSMIEKFVEEVISSLQTWIQTFAISDLGYQI